MGGGVLLKKGWRMEWETERSLVDNDSRRGDARGRWLFII